MTILRNLALFALIIASTCFQEYFALDSSCGNWLAFKDEWCYKIVDETFRHFDEAEKSCAQLDNGSSLPMIRTKDEQDFLANYLFKLSKNADSFWIGAKFSNSSNKFQWVDNTDVSFTNWVVNGPRNKVGYCVQMQGDEAAAGNWIAEPCETKKNLVVCQKMQTWSLARLQKILLDARKELRDSQEDSRNHIQSLEVNQKALQVAKKELTDSLNDAKAHIKNIEQNPVPIGFIYVQLPNQPEPKSIWPTVGWSQVTADYAGQFFRAEGGGSATFGSVQEGDCPRLTTVEVQWLKFRTFQDESISLTPGHWSQFLRSGGPNPNNNDHNALKFLNSNVEVRPRNQAVRIWKRST